MEPCGVKHVSSIYKTWKPTALLLTSSRTCRRVKRKENQETQDRVKDEQVTNGKIFIHCGAGGMSGHTTG